MTSLLFPCNSREHIALGEITLLRLFQLLRLKSPPYLKEMNLATRTIQLNNLSVLIPNSRLKIRLYLLLKFGKIQVELQLSNNHWQGIQTGTKRSSYIFNAS